MYFIVIYIGLYISCLSLWCSHGRLWELRLSVFTLAAPLALYHANLTMVLTNWNFSVKDLIMT